MLTSNGYLLSIGNYHRRRPKVSIDDIIDQEKNCNNTLIAMSFELTRRLHTGHAVVMDWVLVPKNSQTGPNQRLFLYPNLRIFC